MISKCWKSIPIPKLTRQSKIIIERIITHPNNRANNTKISNNNNNKPLQLLFDIIPQIREDGYFTLNQNYLTKQRGKEDSSGNNNNSNLEVDSFMDMDVKTYKCKNGIQNIHLQLFDDQKQSKIYNKQSSSSSINNNNVNTLTEIDYPYSSSSSSSNNEEEAATSNDNGYKLHLKGYIPYYTNISCKLTNTDIVIKNTHKIEAESKFHISTTNGTIHAYSNITSVSIKLISSNDNSSGSGSGSICFSKLRAQYLYVFIKNGFIKGKLIHGGTSIYMLVKNNNDRIGKHNTDNILDHNDIQSLVNINSIYSSSSNNELVAPAKVIVISPQLHNIIRIKSNHGHLYLRQHITSISTTASNNTCKDDDKKIVNNDEMEEQQQTLNNNNHSIECNSINGSFNIKTYSYVPIDLSPSSILLHIDSLSNKSKSIVQAIDTFTNMNILLNSDINGDTDLKLLSQTSDPDLEDNIIDTLLINDDDDDDDDAILNNDLFYKSDHDQNNEQQDPLIILPTTNNIKSSSTYALSTKNSVIIPNINYYSGTFTTNTNNNDNNNNSIGKINIQSTSLTALDSFSSSSPSTTSSSSSSNEENNNNDNVNPIIVAHVHGTIKIDILTWMDKIRNKFF